MCIFTVLQKTTSFTMLFMLNQRMLINVFVFVSCSIEYCIQFLNASVVNI